MVCAENLLIVYNIKNIAQKSIYMKNANYFKLSTTSDYWTCSLDTEYPHVYRTYDTARCSAKEYFLGLAIAVKSRVKETKMYFYIIKR